MKKELNLVHDTNFIVMPKHCNWMEDQTIIFGGDMLGEMDKCAAAATRKLLRASKCDSAVTVNVNNVNFTYAARCGNIVALKGTIKRTGIKSIAIYVEGWVDTEKPVLDEEGEPLLDEEGDPVMKPVMIKNCDGMFTFASKLKGVFTAHKLPRITDGKVVE